MKKILSCLLIVAILLSFAVPVSAATVTTRTVPLDLTAQTTDLSSSAEGWSWKADTRTLTLSGVRFDVYVTEELHGNGQRWAIGLPENSTVVVADGTVNDIAVTAYLNSDGEKKCSNGIHFKGNDNEGSFARFTGKGTLNVTNDTAGGFGIATYNVQDTTVENVTMNLRASGANGEGIDANNVTILDADITTIGAGYGLFTYEDLTIRNSEVLVGAYGLCGCGAYPTDLTVENSLVVLDGCRYALRSNGKVDLTDTAILCGGKLVQEPEGDLVASEKETVTNIGRDASKTVIIGKPANAQLYRDVKLTDWFYAHTAGATAAGLMYGEGAGYFGPNGQATRAMMVAMLYRMAGSPAVTEANPFTDVKPTDWYYPAVVWARANGVAYGTTDTTFSPNDPLTRAQICAFLYRYAGQYLETIPSKYTIGGYTMEGRADLSGYTDAAQINAYARDAVQWCVANGLMYGMSDTVLAPQSHGDRAQLAAFLLRFCHFVNNWG